MPKKPNTKEDIEYNDSSSDHNGDSNSDTGSSDDSKSETELSSNGRRTSRSSSIGSVKQGNKNPQYAQLHNKDYQQFLQTIFPDKYLHSNNGCGQTILDMEFDEDSSSSEYEEEDAEDEDEDEDDEDDYYSTSTSENSKQVCINSSKTTNLDKSLPKGAKIFNIFMPQENYSDYSESEDEDGEFYEEHEDDPLSSETESETETETSEEDGEKRIHTRSKGKEKAKQTKHKEKNNDKNKDKKRGRYKDKHTHKHNKMSKKDVKQSKIKKVIDKYIDMELTDEHFNTLTPLEKTFWEHINKTKQETNETATATATATENTEKKSSYHLLQHCISECKSIFYDEIMKRSIRIKKEKERNHRIYKQITANQNEKNDEAYFNTLNSADQNALIKKMRALNSMNNSSTPPRIKILENDNIPLSIKAIAMEKIACFQKTSPDDGDYSKLKYWIDTFMKIPFGVFKEQPVTIEDGPEKCHEFMIQAQETLDNVTHGLNDAKMQILQYLGQLVTNPKAIGTSIAIQGPMGTGKTTLVRDGISKILNRPFAFIALGGATDSSFLEGHSYTYVGSVIGKILQIIIESKCMNPVIYFDELDKISDTPRGEEITGILTHLTDTTQNSQFHDKYFSEFEFDLSKCLFIFSYNDEAKVNPILKDRMYNIRTQGYERPEKTIISKLHLMPNICKQMAFKNDDVIIKDDIIHYIIDHYCVKQYNMEEKGVRNLKRYLEIIYSKINLYRLVKPGTTMCGEKNVSFEIAFPFTLTREIVDKFIKNMRKDERSDVVLSMYM